MVTINTGFLSSSVHIVLKTCYPLAFIISFKIIQYPPTFCQDLPGTIVREMLYLDRNVVITIKLSKATQYRIKDKTMFG